MLKYTFCFGILLVSVAFTFFIYQIYNETTFKDFADGRFQLINKNTITDNQTKVEELIRNEIKLVENNVVMNETELNDKLMKECNFSVSHIKVKITNGSILSMKNYKNYQAEQFVKKHANHPQKTGITPKLLNFRSMDVPNPRSRLKNADESINFEMITKNLYEEKQRRLNLGDDDILKIKEVKEELNLSNYSIPNILHFIWFGCNRRFKVHHYISILSAYKYQQPRIILFHSDCKPVGDYWNILTTLLGTNLRIVKRSQPDQIWGLKINVIEHRADVARLQIMFETGGIYIDTDTVVLKSADPLRNFSMVLSQEMQSSVANGIILANRDAWFLKRWYWEYRYFQDNQWGLNSVMVAWSLWKIFPNQVHVETQSMCRPGFSELYMIYREVFDWHNNYMIHLYARMMLGQDGTSERSLKELAILNSTYGQIARHVIWGDEKPRDITDWIVTCNMTKVLLT